MMDSRLQLPYQQPQALQEPLYFERRTEQRLRAQVCVALGLSALPQSVWSALLVVLLATTSETAAHALLRVARGRADSVAVFVARVLLTLVPSWHTRVVDARTEDVRPMASAGSRLEDAFVITHADDVLPGDGHALDVLALLMENTSRRRACAAVLVVESAVPLLVADRCVVSVDVEDGAWMDDQTLARVPQMRTLAQSVSPSMSRERVTTSETLAVPLSTKDRTRLSTTCTNQVFVCTDVQQFIRNLVSSLRMQQEVAGGCSPTTVISVERAARVAALVAGRDFVTPDDVLHVLFSVVSHRVVLSQQLYALLHDSSDADPLVSPTRTAGSATGASPRSNALPSSLHAFLDTILRQARRAVSVPVHVRGPR